MEKFKEMGQGSTWRLLVKYSLPAIAGMLLVSLYNVVDRIFVGQATGPIGLAAVTVALPIMMLGFAGAIMANAGGSSLIARLLGSGDKEGAEKAVAQAAVLGALVSLITGLLCLPFLDKLLLLFGASPETMGPAKQFSLIIMMAFAFQGAGMGVASGVRSQGKAKTSMFLMLAGLGVNIILCAIFVNGLGWGVAGSAWATFWSQIISLAISLGFYLSGAGSLRLHLRNFKPNGKVLGEIAKVGMGAWIGNVVPVVLFIILNNVMARLAGDIGIAMIGIVNILTMLAVMPIFGIMQGVAPIIGYNHGAGNFVRVRRAFFQCLAASTVVLVVFWGLVELFPEAIIRAFTKDPELLALGIRGASVFMLIMPLIGLPLVLMQYYQSIGKGMQSAVLGMARQVIFLVPALIIMPALWGMDGVIWAGPVSDGLGVILAVAFFLYELPRINKAAEAVPAEQAQTTAQV